MKMKKRKQTFALVIFALIIFAFMSPSVFAQANGSGYWAAIELGNGFTYSASNVFRSQACDVANDHVWKYVESIIGHKEKGGAFVIYCKATRQEIEDKIKAPASYQLVKQWTIPDDPLVSGGSTDTNQNSPSVSGNKTSSPDSSNNDDSDRANERTKFFNQQNGRTTVVNPNGSTSIKLVRKAGESDEDFRARERAEMYNQQKNDGKINPDGSRTDSAWTEEDGKKYTQGKKGHWATGSFKATAWGADKMFMVTGYVDGSVVDENGKGAFKGTFLEIQNSSPNYPVYYGLSGVINKKLEPGEKVTEDLHIYRAIDPAKRANEPDTVVEITVKYWVP